jgi:hypothetical protein
VGEDVGDRLGSVRLEGHGEEERNHTGLEGCIFEDFCLLGSW